MQSVGAVGCLVIEISSSVGVEEVRSHQDHGISEVQVEHLQLIQARAPTEQEKGARKQDRVKAQSWENCTKTGVQGACQHCLMKC